MGRPVARMVDDGWTLEVNRTCTDGTKNANSMLYGACRRVTFGLGYRKLITYILPTESGSSLIAAGWKCFWGIAAEVHGSCISRPRIDKHPDSIKTEVGICESCGIGLIYTQALGHPCIWLTSRAEGLVAIGQWATCAAFVLPAIWWMATILSQSLLNLRMANKEMCCRVSL